MKMRFLYNQNEVTKLKKIIKFLKEVREIMVELYVVLILKGMKTIDSVPALIRDDVQKMLNEILG